MGMHGRDRERCELRLDKLSVLQRYTEVLPQQSLSGASWFVWGHQLVNFIDSKPPGTRFALSAISDGLHLMQGFTDDRSQLLAALDLQGKRPRRSSNSLCP
jgi:hypothetical protein